MTAVRPLGPGPGAYMLPPTYGYDKHDNRKQRNPQYSFGMRTNLVGSELGPGPGAYKVDKLTRYGPSKGLEYSMSPRTEIPIEKVGPGPGAHDVHLKPFFTGVNAPSYSMGLRTDINFKKEGPGPIYKYEMNPVRPKVPAYSMGLQTKILNKTNSPGPAAYGPGDINVKLNRAPQYSMAPRTNMKGENVGPGSNYYDLMYYRPGKSGPGYSFGVRHSQYAPPMIVRCDNM
ncbi:ciliary microtubule associated protein 1B [Drosophila bipectinata]|uniref:ciliary microtubule associated protein 1B n=1 Tax=Drosophila bipectinata TaxID=42026 RepID=UPI001C8A36BF|nr:outer dense fiber protein 3-B [Drosophila bipectinata]